MHERRVVITGAGGMLGKSVHAVCRAHAWASHALDREQLDITDPLAIRRVLDDLAPNVLINCAAYTDVDGAETDESTAFDVNAEGPRHLAHACRASGIHLVHFSTDYVFDGTHDRPITVDAMPKPQCAYGRTKLAGERRILSEGGTFTIIRTSWLYSEHGQNFVNTMLRLGREHDTLRVVDDQHGRPTYAADLAQAALSLIEHGAKGLFHYANSGHCTWREFATAIMADAGLRCEVEPCTSDEFPRPARRPAWSVLDLSTAEEIIGQPRSWRDALRACLREHGNQPLNAASATTEE